MAEFALNLAGGAGMNPLELRPVGSIYQSVVDVNPGALFGGTWQRYGNGRVAVGLNTGDADFNATGKTGGAKAHTLTSAEMPAHSHSIALSQPALPSTGMHTHALRGVDLALRPWTGSTNGPSAGDWLGEYLLPGGAHVHTVTPAGAVGTTTGGGSAHTNLMPFFTAYAWKRVA